jgi:asparagine synthase (glutamine-hydrolysing)
VDEPKEELEALIAAVRGEPVERIGQLLDYRSYLPNDVLTKVDIASMCHGLEARTPFADVKVAEFVATIPCTANLAADGPGRPIGKQLLRRILRRRFSREFVDRPKMGFSIPLRYWFGPGGPLRRSLEDRVLNRDAALFEYLRPDAVRRLLDSHDSGEADNSQRLWQLLFLQCWLEQAPARVEAR